jgi:hypothetical protein
MMWRLRADPEQKQDSGGVTIAQGLDARRPITEALPWQINGLVGFSAASFAQAGMKRWQGMIERTGRVIFSAGWRLF